MKKRHFLTLLTPLSMFLIMAFTTSARADHLELRNGQIVEGKFLGGSPLNVRFQVDGKEQIFATKEVLNIGFDEANPEPPSPTSAAPAPSSSSPQAASTVSAAGTNSGQVHPQARLRRTLLLFLQVHRY